MLTNSINTADGLTNGAMGTVTYVVGHNVNAAILVKFDNALVGHVVKQNSKYNHISTSSIPIKQYQASFQIHGKRLVDTSQIQFSLILSWAITIHKLQGLTLDAVVVDMVKSNGDNQCGQAHVAFSHVK